MGTSNLYISDFYICDLSSGQCRDLSIISQWRKIKKKVSRSVLTDRNSPNLLDSWLFGAAMMAKVRFLANSLLKGHQRSLEAANSFFFVNNSEKRDRTLGWLHCVCVIKTRRLICNMTYFSHYVTLTWRQILTLTFQGQIIYLSKHIYERNTMMPLPILYLY